jgi:hypothetical protein
MRRDFLWLHGDRRGGNIGRPLLWEFYLREVTNLNGLLEALVADLNKDAWTVLRHRLF